RRTGHLENIRKQRKTYPVIAKEVIDNADIILEVLDARFIEETRNKKLEEHIKKTGKRIIYVLNKIDLIKKIKKEELSEIYPYVLISATTKRGNKELRSRMKIEAKKIEKPISDLGKVSIGVIGYPNTGKSSLINMLVGKHSAGTGADAGFTRGIQKINLTSDIQLVDSPGVIPEEEYSQTLTEKIAKHAKVGGRSYSQIKEPDMIIATIMNDFKGVLEKYYGIDAKGDSEILLEELGRKKGFLKRGGKVNEDTTARLIIKDWQQGKIKV
ncbi:MAG TPA: GTPase, partial [Candidatus Nanoarchaeia archaeon]|nr:GTPase [Candidatus Nanoarchaeia archaeon]